MSDEHVTIAGMTFHLSRGKCPECGAQVKVGLERTSNPQRLATTPHRCPECGVPVDVVLERIEKEAAEVLPFKPKG